MFREDSFTSAWKSLPKICLLWKKSKASLDAHSPELASSEAHLQILPPQNLDSESGQQLLWHLQPACVPACLHLAGKGGCLLEAPDYLLPASPGSNAPATIFLSGSLCLAELLSAYLNTSSTHFPFPGLALHSGLCLKFPFNP